MTSFQSGLLTRNWAADLLQTPKLSCVPQPVQDAQERSHGKKREPSWRNPKNQHPSKQQGRPRKEHSTEDAKPIGMRIPPLKNGQDRRDRGIHENSRHRRKQLDV
jgi:hypothetical protein